MSEPLDLFGHPQQPPKFKCFRCQTPKVAEDFPFKDKKHGQRHTSVCTACLTLRSAEHRTERQAEWQAAEAAGELDIRTRRCCKCKNHRSLSMFSPQHSECLACGSERGRQSMRSASGRYNAAKHIAARRGLDFELTKEEYLALIALPCHYCGGVLNETGGGLDRIQNEIRSYRNGNSVPCCGVCNNLKCSLFTYDEMRLFGAVVAQIREKRTAEGKEPLDSHAHARRRKYPPANNQD